MSGGTFSPQGMSHSEIPFPMRTKFRVAVLLLLLSAGLSFSLRAARLDFEDGVARIVTGYAYSTNDARAASAIFGISSGGTFGKNNTSEMNIEWLAGVWKTSRYDNDGRLTDASRELHMPVMLNYRYYIRIPKVAAALYVGAGAGVHLISATFDTRSATTQYNYDGTQNKDTWWDDFDYALTAAGTVGLAINLSKRGGIDIGWRCVWQSGSWHDFRDEFGNHDNAPTVWTKQDRMRMISVCAHWAF